MKNRHAVSVVRAALLLCLVCAGSPAASINVAPSAGRTALTPRMNSLTMSGVQLFIFSKWDSELLKDYPALRGVMRLHFRDEADMQALGSLGAELGSENFRDLVMAAADSPDAQKELSVKFRAAYDRSLEPALAEITVRAGGLAALMEKPGFDLQNLDEEVDKLRGYAIYGPAAARKLASVRAAATHAKAYGRAQEVAKAFRSYLSEKGIDIADAGALPQVKESGFKPLAPHAPVPVARPGASPSIDRAETARPKTAAQSGVELLANFIAQTPDSAATTKEELARRIGERLREAQKTGMVAHKRGGERALPSIVIGVLGDVAAVIKRLAQDAPTKNALKSDINLLMSDLSQAVGQADGASALIRVADGGVLRSDGKASVGLLATVAAIPILGGLLFAGLLGKVLTSLVVGALAGVVAAVLLAIIIAMRRGMPGANYRITFILGFVLPGLFVGAAVWLLMRFL